MAASTNVDFDLHGIVGIRVMGATDAELRAIRRQLGPIEGSLSRPPDVTLRFCAAPPRAGPLRYLTHGESAHDDAGYYVLRDDQGLPTRTMIPLERVGDRCEIVCPRGTRGVRLLLAVVNLTALWKGVVPLHGTAFVHGRHAILVTGWAKGGKTETLLAFAQRGATYVGDEWIYLDPDTREMRGIPEPIRLWEWHLRAAPEFGAALTTGQRTRLRVGRVVVDALETLGGPANRSRSLGGRAVRRALPMLRRQLSVQIPPVRLFGADGTTAGGVAPSTLIWAVGGEFDGTSVRPVAGGEVARRMASSVEFEWQDLFAHYLQFRYAFPDAVNERLAAAPARLAEMLVRALEPLPAWELSHPYPVEIPELYRAVSEVLDGGTTQAAARSGAGG